VDVRAERRVQSVLPEIEPVLPLDEGADLHHPQIVVGVAEREAADRIPALAHQISGHDGPGQQD
jgi:hypothetical protein